MIASLRLQNFGPHADLTIPFTPTTLLSAPSEAGKSMLLEAVCFVLWGVSSDGKALDVAFIRNDAPECEVELRTAKGAIFRRKKTRRGTNKRERQLPNETAPLEYRSEEDWRAMLGPLGKGIARLVAVPLAWHGLNPANGNREFRDIVAALLPTEDLRAEVERIAGFPVTSVPSVKDAEAGQTAANAAKEQAKGALQALAEQRVEELPLRPEADIEPCRTLLAAAKAWEAHDRIVDKSKSEREMHEARIKSYEKRRDAIPPEPPLPASVVAGGDASAATKRLADARGALGRAQMALNEYERLTSQWQRALTAMTASPSVCPTCKQPHDQRKAISDLEAQEPSAPEDNIEALKDAIMLASKEEVAIRTANQHVIDQRNAHAAWVASRDALGDPPEPFQNTIGNGAPTELRPNASEIQGAKTAILAWEKHNAQAALVVQQAKRRTLDFELAKNRLAASEESVKWAVRLLAAVKQAPGEIAKRQMDAIGDLGPVSLRFEGMGVEVLVDGRPFWLASTGKQLAADCALRSALRRLAKLEYFPIWIDNRQSWSGELGVAAPVVEIRTGGDAWVVESLTLVQR